MHDVTKRKDVEKQLRQAQKMESLGTLSGGIAHEFNNLLSPILGYTELLINGKSGNDPELRYLRQIQAAGERSKELILQLLAFGRQSLSQKKSLRLEAVIDDAINLLQRTISVNIAIRKEIDPGLPPIRGTHNEIHQVNLNLCINASHAMPNGGDLIIRLKKQVTSNRQQSDDDFLTLSIQDTGSGIDKTIIDRIFDPFFTTKDVGQGSGLGLSVVQGIVEQHRGFLEVESEVGKGSVFHVFLPTTKEEVSEAMEIPVPIPTGKERIMLVDDESMVHELTKDMLEQLGYEVSGFLDPFGALNQFAKNPDAFDLVITDYGMPKLNGRQFAQEIKKIRPNIPVVLLTGYGNLVAKENIHEWGISDLLPKPFNLKELGDSVREALFVDEGIAAE